MARALGGSEGRPGTGVSWPAVAFALLVLAAAGPAAAQDSPRPGWWCHPEKNRAMEALLKELDEDAGRIKFGDYSSLEAVRREVKGFVPTTTLMLWNVWLDPR
jgi:hypothetical protein